MDEPQPKTKEAQSVDAPKAPAQPTRGPTEEPTGVRFPPRQWLGAAVLAILATTGAMYAAERMEWGVSSRLGLAVTTGLMIFLSFTPWRWLKRLNSDRATMARLARRLRAIDLENRQRSLTTVLLDRDDEFGDLSRAVHDCLAQALAARAEARMLQRTMRDTIERRTRLATARLERESFSDALTGLGNRRALDEFKGDFERRRSEETDTRHLIAMMIDIDHFKQVNDCLGHEAGDDCIVFLAELLGCTVRESDAVIRLGGDEFLIIMRESVVERAQALAERLTALFNQMPWPHQGARRPTLSIGLAQASPVEADAIDEVIRRADQALYAAKTRGRNRTATYSTHIGAA